VLREFVTGKLWHAGSKYLIHRHLPFSGKDMDNSGSKIFFTKKIKIMQASKTKVLNGVDIKRLEGTIAAVTENPAIADFKFRAVNKWITGGHNRSRIKGFYGACQEDDTRTETFVMDNDEPQILLREDNGANPVEYVLHALAGCLTTTMVYHRASKAIWTCTDFLD
jgi:hypothetical protein